MFKFFTRLRDIEQKKCQTTLSDIFDLFFR